MSHKQVDANQIDAKGVVAQVPKAKKANSALTDYFSSLTSPEHAEQTCPLAVASKLLEQANLDYIQPSVKEPEINTQTHKENDVLAETVECTSLNTDISSDLNEKLSATLSLQERLPGRFQVLLFEVAGLKLAAPLVELGRLIELSELAQLPGKPSWFMGVLLKGKEKHYCVDTALFISPERYEQIPQEVKEYSYTLQLGDTPWSLACSGLATTHEVTHDEVNWRNAAKNRPWFAGMIKQQMCALIDVSQMIKQLESSPTNALTA